MIKIISVSNYAKAFMAYSKAFAYKVGYNPELITLAACNDVVEAFLYKTLSGSALWLDLERERTRGQSMRLSVTGQVNAAEIDLDILIDDKMLYADAYLDKALTRVFPWYTDGTEFNDALSDQYYEDVVDPMFLQVADSIEKLNPQLQEPSWMIWRVTRLGRELTLSQHHDYRICDWERQRRVKSEPKVVAPRKLKPRPVVSAYAEHFAQRQHSVEAIAVLFKPSQVLSGASITSPRPERIAPRHEEGVLAAMVRERAHRPFDAGTMQIKQARDLNGQLIYDALGRPVPVFQYDKEGQPILDGFGNPKPVWVSPFVDTDEPEEPFEASHRRNRRPMEVYVKPRPTFYVPPSELRKR